MGMFLVTPPADEPVSLAEVKAHLRVLHSDDDTYLGLIITAARQHSERRGLQAVTATWKQTLDAWPEDGKPIKLFRNPAIAITHIKYYDEDDAEQTLSADDYQLSAPDGERARVNLVYNAEWPDLYPDKMDAISITFTAGFGAASDCPDLFKRALMQIISEFYDRREEVAPGAPLHRVPIALDSILRRYEIVGV